MQAGLQCWDETGKLIFDSTIQTTYAIDYVYTNAQNGSIEDEKLLGGTPWISIVDVVGYNGGVQQDAFSSFPNFTVSGKKISWVYESFAGAKNINCAFVYGVY